MKKTILTIVALLSMIGVASPNKFDYNGEFNKIVINQPDNYFKTTINVSNEQLTGLGLLNGDGTGLTGPTTTLGGKYLIPKSVEGHETITFHNDDPNFKDLAALDELHGEVINNGKAVTTINLGGSDNDNNVPLFVYIYDKVTKQLHKVYKEDGTRAAVRQIHTENVTALTPESLKDGSFELGNGYIEANDLYKLMIGEIKDNDPEKTEVTDRSRYGVSGKTVFDYLEAEKTAANMENPVNKFVTDTKVKAYIDGLNLGGGNGVAAANEFEYDKSGAVPTIEFKTDKGTDKILKGIAKAVNPNEAVNKAQLDETKQELEEKINGMGGGVSKATAGVSTAIAIANLPLEFTKERPNSFAFGIGYYGKHAGFALGYGRKLIDNSLTLKLSSSINTAADVAAGAGIGYSW